MNLKEFVFEGHGAGGKSSVVPFVKSRLEEESIRVVAIEPFPLAENSVPSVYPLDHRLYSMFAEGQDSALEAERLVVRVMEENKRRFLESLGDDDVTAVILWIREWMTFIRSFDDVPWDSDVVKGEAYSRWLDREQHPMFFFEASPELTRSHPDFKRTSPWNASDEIMQFEFDRRMELLSDFKGKLLSHYVRPDRSPEWNRSTGLDVASRILRTLL